MTDNDGAFKELVASGGFDGMADPKPRKGGRRSRDKGNRSERLIVNTFLAAGIHSERVPLSGAAGGSYVGDLTVAVNGQDWLAESKVRANGFRTLYDWLGSNRLLFVRSDRNPQLVVMRQSDFIDLVRGKR